MSRRDHEGALIYSEVDFISAWNSVLSFQTGPIKDLSGCGLFVASGFFAGKSGRRDANPDARAECAPQIQMPRSRLRGRCSPTPSAPLREAFYAARALKISMSSLAEAGILVPGPKIATAPAWRRKS